MNIKELLDLATNKENFVTLENYIQFCQYYLDFLPAGLQAVVVSQNESNYRFFQYREDGNFNITRPINATLMYTAENNHLISNVLLGILRAIKEDGIVDETSRVVIQRAIYTIQQSIGATLDALPGGRSNTARKINGDLFERLIRLLIQYIGVDCRTGVINVPVIVDDIEEFKMSYQHDLLLFYGDELKVIGSVKTSSKDRLDKIFMDKFLYSRLTGTEIPHIAIFLNDVQRKQTRHEDRYGINSTFLPGHFRGFTVKLNALDGVYYCDIRPSMQTDAFLRQHIKTIDCLFCDDVQHFIEN